MYTETMPPFLDAAATARRLPFDALVAAVRCAVLDLAAGRIRCPERGVVAMADGATLLSMPAVASDLAAHKLISVTPGNARRGLPTIRGQLSVLDPHTGATILVLDGPAATGRRTAAMSMLALHSLWPQQPRHVLLIGAGAQAQHHVDALAALHPGVAVTLRASSALRAEAFCAGCGHPGVAPDTGACDGADVVITCTSSRVPVYADAARAGRLVIAVGAFQAGAAEIAADTVRASICYVDDPQGARHEAGDLIQAGVPWDSVLPLSEALQHGALRHRPLLFKSVGCAAWDLAAARVATRPQPTP